ncbi:MAG TPA: nucleoside hydrolase, partial [Candidatus Egerieenecus merdigallinarum]|nr:nucleoside hydrolase [Candidatus Egerieenecus merdigallinarum]
MDVQRFGPVDAAALVKRLQRPAHPVDVVLDTDAYNEIDDQYAIAYLLLHQEKLHTQALYAAPFSNARADSPAEGMQKSHEEILHILALMHMPALKNQVFQGAEAYLPDEFTPVHSPAAADLSVRAMRYSPEHPLYVVAIGAITNIASALLLNPEIRDRIV